MASGQVSAGLIRGLVDYAVSRGADRAALVAASGIDLSRLDDPDARFAFASYEALMRAAKVMCGDAAFALHYGASVDMAEISIVGLIMNASETMADAFAQLQRYGRLAMEIGGAGPRFDIAVVDGQPWIVDRRLDPDAFPELGETAFARLVCGPRRFLSRAHVLEVHFTHAAPPWRDAYDDVFQCKVAFSSKWNAMRLDPETGSWRVALQPRYVFGILTEKADQLIRSLDEAATLRARVEALLLPSLHKGDFSASKTAAKLGFSRHTLFRKLRDEGASFALIVDDLRRRMALHYLRGGRVSVSEAAYLTGFSDRAAFSRAFKRWTGKGPGEMRGQIRLDAARVDAPRHASKRE